MKKTIICIMGPTAASKTDIAIQLHQHFGYELISVDSAMIYKGMDIGTAKPTREQLQLAPHRLIDICEPYEMYSVGQFKQDALACIHDIHQQQNIPVLVGGTMMYFKSLLYGLADLPQKNTDFREQLTQEANQFGWPTLHERLMKVDPASAARIHPHDAQRIQRALEVQHISNTSLHQLQQENINPLHDYHVILICIAPGTRERLHERIALRLQHMLNAGFLEEARHLYDDPRFDFTLPAMRIVGYHQAFLHFQGKISANELPDRILFATRQLAKRQLTWLRHWPESLTWFDSDDGELLAGVARFIAHLSNNVLKK